MKSPLSGPDTLNVLLLDCLRYKVCLRKNTCNGEHIEYGKFRFYVLPHSTGNTVQGYIVNKDKTYQIIGGTYWFSSHYTFNEFTWENGKWDKALNEVISELRKLVAIAREREDEEARKAKEIEDKRRQAEKEEFEALFN